MNLYTGSFCNIDLVEKETELYNVHTHKTYTNTEDFALFCMPYNVIKISGELARYIAKKGNEYGENKVLRLIDILEKIRDQKDRYYADLERAEQSYMW